LQPTAAVVVVVEDQIDALIINIHWFDAAQSYFLHYQFLLIFL
jgi:hypothetical protein